MFKADLWILSTLFCLGVIAGLSFLLFSSSPETPRIPNGCTRHPAEIARCQLACASRNIRKRVHPRASRGQPARDSGDQFLITGNFNAAAGHFQKVQQLNGRFSSDISIRLGFCAEQTNQPVVAATHYQRALSQNPSPLHRRVAIAGLTRTMIARGDRQEALRELSDLFLESLDPESMPEELRAQAAFQLGTVLQSNALTDYHFDLSRPDGVGFRSTTPEVSALLKLLNQPPADPELSDGENPNKEITGVAATGQPSITVLQRPTNSINLTVVDASSQMHPVEVLVMRLTSSCDLQLSASPRAQSAIRGRSQTLAAKLITASLLLDGLLMPLNLGWQQVEDQIQLFSLDEVSADDLKQFWFAAAERSFRRFNLAFPGDYRSESALLSRGNLKFLEGDFDGAANYYQELASQRPRDEMLARLFFNLGKVQLRLGRNQEAIRQFFYAVDQSYDTAFQSTGYWLAGQLLLETHQLEESIKATGRALATASSDQQKRLAALTMARSYLLNNQPFAANQVLFENRQSFAGSEQQSAAAVLGSYARYVGVTDKNSLNAEANRLLAAVAMASDQSYENFLDIYIAGRAYQELGFQEKALEKLTLAADSTTIFAWKRQFLFELGVQLTIADKLDEATSVFEFLIAGEIDQWHLKSRLQLAQVYLRKPRVQDCIDICESLLASELTEAEKQSTLNTMGQAYRLLGEHHSAALCFAGALPTRILD